MRSCFVMQPFDGGTFDKRYDSVFAPAIKAAGVQPYRVDRDPSVSIPIQEIERGIRDSVLCFADITTDNPNVWFELGFALAIPREVILVCSDERTTKYPFDIQHRSIISYKTGAPQDFEELKVKITKRIKAVLKKNEEIGRVVTHSVVKDTEGLNQHEIVALATILQNSFLTNGYVGGYQIRNDMNAAGFTDIAVGLALKTLERKGMIETDIWTDERDGEPYAVYKITEMGEQWLINHQEKLTLKKENTEIAPTDDVPF
ncbi:PadR family transcriptional regulator [Dissulfuribacter thermophilus]|nr:helix-turn-helix transcriptional regulator [Dissulfuribacter thermophilus]